MVSTFAEGVNEIYNPDDEPGSYVFGFDAVLTRPISGRNLLMEEEYGYYGREGDANITLLLDEVDMTLPFAGSDEFSIVNTTPISPEDFAGQTTFIVEGKMQKHISEVRIQEIYSLFMEVLEECKM